MKILIQGAMDIEIEYLISKLENKKNKKILDYEFYEGTIKEIELVISKTLIGTLNSSLSTTLGIMNFKPDIVINQGIAGGHTDKWHTGDIIIGEKCCNINAYSMPNKKENEGSNPFEWKENEYLKNIQNADTQLVELIYHYMNNKTKRKVTKGILGSGDVFNREIDRIKWINKKFNNDSEDMESIGTYSVCNKFGIPCVGIRIISNNEILLEKLEENTAIKLQEELINVIQELSEKW